METFLPELQIKARRLYREGRKEESSRVINLLENEYADNLDFYLFKQSYYNFTGDLELMVVALENAAEINPQKINYFLTQRLIKAYRALRIEHKIQSAKEKLIDSKLSSANDVWESYILDKEELNEVTLRATREELEKYFFCTSKFKEQKNRDKLLLSFPYLQLPDLKTFEKRNKERLETAFLFQDDIIKNGFIELICPYSGKPVVSNESYFVQSGNSFICYLFKSVQPFFVLIGDVWNEIIGYYFPIEDIFVRITTSRLKIENIVCKLKSLIAFNYIYLKNLKSHNRKKCIVIRNKHFAHHLWNELSALDRIIKKKLHQFIDVIYVLEHPLGAIDQIFEEIKGKVVNISFEKKKSLEEELIQSNYQVLPLGDAFIPQDLILRLKSKFNETVGNLVDEEIREFSKKSDFNLWISFRFGSKTWDKQVEGYLNLIISVRQKYPKLGVIIDGFSLPFNYTHNKKLIFVMNQELILINELKEQLLELNIPYKILTRTRIDEAIKWGEIADYYIVHQGTIQHKIAWFHDCPGYIHANKKHLEVDYKERPGVWEREHMIPPVYIDSSIVNDSEEMTFMRGQWWKGGTAANYGINLKKMKSQIILEIDKMKTNSMKTNNSKWGETPILKPNAFSKINYTTVLKKVHELYKKNYYYFEVGTFRGNSMRLAKGHAVGVDVNFVIEQNIMLDKQSLNLYQTTSDDFFDQYADQVYNLNKIDVAFIDGLHYSEQVLLDFLNVEKYSNRNAIYFFHDVLPRTFETALKDRSTQMWTGDVWKAIWVLKQLRDDLEFLFLDAPPSGLLMVRHKSQTDEIGSHSKEIFLEKLSNVKDEQIYSYYEDIEVTNSFNYLDYVDKNHKLPRFHQLKKRKLMIEERNV